jgi:predicted transcriptional regulator
MLCSDCVEKLYFNIYIEHTDAITILKAINKADRPLNQSEIVRKTGLTTSLARDTLNILWGAKLVNAETRGRATCYSLSDDFKKSMVYLRGDLLK